MYAVAGSFESIFNNVDKPAIILTPEYVFKSLRMSLSLQELARQGARVSSAPFVVVDVEPFFKNRFTVERGVEISAGVDAPARFGLFNIVAYIRAKVFARRRDSYTVARTVSAISSEAGKYLASAIDNLVDTLVSTGESLPVLVAAPSIDSRILEIVRLAFNYSRHQLYILAPLSDEPSFTKTVRAYAGKRDFMVVFLNGVETEHISVINSKGEPLKARHVVEYVGKYVELSRVRGDVAESFNREYSLFSMFIQHVHEKHIPEGTIFASINTLFLDRVLSMFWNPAWVREQRETAVSSFSLDDIDYGEHLYVETQRTVARWFEDRVERKLILAGFPMDIVAYVASTLGKPVIPAYERNVWVYRKRRMWMYMNGIYLGTP